MGVAMYVVIVAVVVTDVVTTVVDSVVVVDVAVVAVVWAEVGQLGLATLSGRSSSSVASCIVVVPCNRSRAFVIFSVSVFTNKYYYYDHFCYRVVSRTYRYSRSLTSPPFLLSFLSCVFSIVRAPFNHACLL